jgi:DNA-binding response OmpR family regulator
MQKNIKIAVIDDEPDILAMIQKYIQRNSSYDIDIYQTPKSYLQSIDICHDVVLCDIMLPQMNGFDLSEHIKANCKDSSIILMTAYSTLQDVLKAKNITESDYILKPFSSLKDLLIKINSHIKADLDNNI